MLPSWLPARKSVHPNSPKARAKASTVPEAMDDQAKGSMRRMKMRPLDQPRVRAASSMFGSKLSKAPRALRYMSGKATTTAAMTVACQLNTSGNPISWKKRPKAVLRPSADSKRKPQTVGGSTMGMVKMVSKMSWARLEMRSVKYAAASPRKNTNTMATPQVLSVTHKGE